MAESDGAVVRPVGWIRRLVQSLFWTHPPMWLHSMREGVSSENKLKTWNLMGVVAMGVLGVSIALQIVKGAEEQVSACTEKQVAKETGGSLLSILLTSLVIPIASTVYAFVVVERTTFNATTRSLLEERYRLQRFFFGVPHRHNTLPKIGIFIPEFPAPTEMTSNLYALHASDTDYTGSITRSPIYAVSAGRFSKCAAFRDIQAVGMIVQSIEFYLGQSAHLSTSNPDSRKTTLLRPKNFKLNISMGLFSNQFSLNVLNEDASCPKILWRKQQGDEFFVAVAQRDCPDGAIAYSRVSGDGTLLEGSHAQAKDIALVVRYYDEKTGDVWFVIGGFRDFGTHAAGRYFSETLVKRVLENDSGVSDKSLYWEILEVRGDDNEPTVEGLLASSTSIEQKRPTVHDISAFINPPSPTVPRQSEKELRLDEVMNSALEGSHSPPPATESHSSEKAQDPPPDHAA